jgi:hypothetical protein
VPLQEKVESAASGIVSGPALFPALKRFWKAISAENQRQPVANLAWQGRDFEKHNYAMELHGVIDSLVAVRRRILTSTYLQGWMKWWTWILGGLIVAGAVSTKLVGVVILAAILVMIGSLVIVFWTWRSRPSAYDTACRLDSVADLYDRGSTALYFGAIENPGGMMLRQRRDAITRLALVQPPALFPIRMPATTGRMLVLALAVAGLFVYRLHHRPPMVALWQSTVRSPLVRSTLPPFVHAIEQNLRRTAASMNLRLESLGNETRLDEATPPADDLWQPDDENGFKAEDSQDANLDEQQQNQSLSRAQDEMKPGDSKQSDSQQSWESKEAQGTANNSQQQSGSQNSRQSLSQSLMQALKSVLSSSPGQQMPNQANTQPAPIPQTVQNTGSGAGNQQGSKEIRKDQPALEVKAVPDRVLLESNKFKEKTHVRADTETGTAQIPVRNVSPQAVAVINGSEQENIPARYRFYVQHYFEHAGKNGQQ